MEAELERIEAKLDILNFLLLQQPFVLLKLTGLIDLSWVLVMMPTIVLGSTAVIGFILFFIVALFKEKPVEREQ